MSGYLHPEYMTPCVYIVGKNKKKMVEAVYWKSESKLYYLPDLESLSLLFSDYITNTCKNI